MFQAVCLERNDMSLITASLINGNLHKLEPSNFLCESVDITQTKVPPRFELGSQDSES